MFTKQQVVKRLNIKASNEKGLFVATKLWIAQMKVGQLLRHPFSQKLPTNIFVGFLVSGMTRTL